MPTRIFLRAFLAAVCFCAVSDAISRPCLASTAELRTFEEILRFVTVTEPRADIARVRSLIPEENWERPSLVYDSESPVGATLALPRLILPNNSDASLIWASAGHPKLALGNQLELMRVDLGTHEPKFVRLAFEKGRDIEVDESQSRCIGCHGYVARDGTVYMRPIIGAYPSGWIGWYNIRPSESRLPTPRFEEVGFKTIDFNSEAYSKVPMNMRTRLSGVHTQSINRLEMNLAIINFQRLVARGMRTASDPGQFLADIKALAQVDERILEKETSRFLNHFEAKHLKGIDVAKISEEVLVDLRKYLKRDQERQEAVHRDNGGIFSQNPKGGYQPYGYTSGFRYTSLFVAILRKHGIDAPDLAMSRDLSLAPFMSGFLGNASVFSIWATEALGRMDPSSLACQQRFNEVR